MVTLRAPAKVNLWLRVLAREESGYHQIETLFQALELADELTVLLEGQGITLTVDGPDLGPVEENLVYRAASGFSSLAGEDMGIQLRLVKRIPVQGGLGGGSSDAAATLRALSQLRPGALTRRELMDLAGSLGADVPFFLTSTSLALGWGRGDRLLSLPPLPRAPVLLAVPPMGVPTPEAYRLLAERRGPGGGPPDSGRIWALEDLSDWRRLAEEACNDFEEVVLNAFPVLEALRRALEEDGPTLSLLSGSGSALFAVFPWEDQAEAALRRLQGLFPEARFLLTHTLAH